MRIGIYHATWGAIGGAESYVGTMAEILGRRASVEILHHNRAELPRSTLEEGFGLDLSGVASRYVPRPERTRFPASNPLKHYASERDWASELSRPYELFIMSGLTAPIFCHAPTGVLLTYFPLEGPDEYHGRHTDEWRGHSRGGRLARRFYQDYLWSRRMASYRLKLSISEFTRSWMRATWGVDSQVVYPPVDIDHVPEEGKKGKSILAIGRFDPQVKKQDVLVRSFIEMYESGADDWGFVLVGGVKDRAEDGGIAGEGARFVEDLKAMARGYPVRFLTNATRADLRALLTSASMFWHATGYGQQAPGLMEHFGIVTVEAMAAGCVPLVFNGGGQPEIVRHDRDGYTWDTPRELIDLTRRLAADDAKLAEMSGSSIRRSREFSRAVFEERLLNLLDPYFPTRFLG